MRSGLDALAPPPSRRKIGSCIVPDNTATSSRDLTSMTILFGCATPGENPNVTVTSLSAKVASMPKTMLLALA